MDSNLGGLSTLFSSCVEVPDYIAFNKNAITLSSSQSNKWIATGIHVSEGKLLQLQWDVANLKPNIKKYTVLYRIDPRFSRPQVFIQKYDYKEQKFVSDFHKNKRNN
jgi:type IV secretion system protein VirB6